MSALTTTAKDRALRSWTLANTAIERALYGWTGLGAVYSSTSTLPPLIERLGTNGWFPTNPNAEAISFGGWFEGEDVSGTVTVIYRGSSLVFSSMSRRPQNRAGRYLIRGGRR